MKKIVSIAVAVAVIVGGGAFYGGMKYAAAKSPGRGASGQFRNLSPEQVQQMRESGGFAGRGGRGGMNGGGFIGGEILSIDGKSLTIKLHEGGSKIVFLGDSTEISKFTAGTSDDLEVGKNVMVAGKTNDDGSVTAQTIQLRPAPSAPPVKE